MRTVDASGAHVQKESAASLNRRAIHRPCACDVDSVQVVDVTRTRLHLGGEVHDNVYIPDGFGGRRRIFDATLHEFDARWQRDCRRSKIKDSNRLARISAEERIDK